MFDALLVLLLEYLPLAVEHLLDLGIVARQVHGSQLPLSNLFFLPETLPEVLVEWVLVLDLPRFVVEVRNFAPYVAHRSPGRRHRRF